MLNRDAQIRVKTSFGLTGIAATGENVAQGSIGGGLISSLNLSKTISTFFSGAEEASYCTLKLSPMLFQDDSARIATSIEEAQKGNILMSKAMKMKQLQLNVNKSGVILFGKKKQVESPKNKIEEEKSLKIDEMEVKVKTYDKYLDDYLHSGGLAKSFEETVSKQYGVCLNMILELKSVIEDFRLLSLSGIKVGIEIFNLAILSMLTYNADTWYEMNFKTIKILENLQNTFIRCIVFQVPPQQ